MQGTMHRSLLGAALAVMALLGLEASILGAAPATAEDKEGKDTQKKEGKDAKKPEPPKGKDGKAALPGIAAKVLKVDTKKRIISAQLADGKKQEFEVPESVRFVGPRGGESEQGIKDDRLAAGSEIRIVMDAAGKKVKEVHLSLRKEAGKKAPEKGKKPEDPKDKGKEKAQKAKDK